MQALPLALFLVMLELTAGSFISLWLLDLRGDSSRGFIIFQGALYAFFALLTLGAMSAFASPQIVRGYGLDGWWLGAQGPLTLAFLLAMLPWNVLLWLDRSPRKGAKGKAAAITKGGARLRLARFALGGAVSLVALADLFVVGMAYRTLADSRLGGALVVLALVFGALALGGSMTAMLLGHWYLNTPTASGKPLEFVTMLTIAGLALVLLTSPFIGPSTARPTIQKVTVAPGTTIQTNGGQVAISTPTVSGSQGQSDLPSQSDTTTREAPITNTALVALEYILGLLAPLVLAGVALYLTRGRSFQSATGMLYLCVSFVFLGEILAGGLLLFPIFL